MELFDYLDTIDHDGKLSLDEFRQLFPSLFYSVKTKTSYKNDKIESLITSLLKLTKQDYVDKTRFNFIWDKWIQVILKPKTALIIVDMQNDFVDINGTMHNPEAYQVVEVINQLIQNVLFDVVVYTYDWHPANHCSFVESVHNRSIHRPIKYTIPPGKSPEELKYGDQVVYEKYPDIKQHLWYKHCVQNTTGADLYGQLIKTKNNFTIPKGTDPDIDSYSAFADNGHNKSSRKQTSLHNDLQNRNITDIYLTGVLYDYCVGYTALDGLEKNYRTVLIEDCIKGKDNNTIDAMKQTLITKYANLVQSYQVSDIVDATDRKPEMSYKLAEKVFK
ncbi:nicotinamidase-like [Oppia nitens]|uniref:nicotinamidase-like n=1 Tax=Oppia nitens TaxID=1686743 RepID=UPI0023DC9C1B|nr:nicotinamidase-like [Oppia nitens]